ncbi:pyruvoyl-dependent arginine decarboxylase [Halegenticoccus soli]|uniref:pyruvoyl-dependent arginine decarboxylase n=1 Tax=Halegenticoccus soli TaxID=1985678 RepID=UPI000C6EB6E7|nr:pyruvoyl-dependent arginine decarboxylase [Halegenticoccus soli]
MNAIHVARGAATAPTELSSYDAALAEANVHNYNLVVVSSIVPAGATVEEVDAVPDLGPAGDRLTVVQARETRAGPGTVAAGLGWATGPGPGLFYEATGDDPDEVAAEIRAGLDAGAELRDWEFTDREVTVTSVEAPPEGYTTALVVAAYGESEPVF